jgi:hypothetical protein
VNVVVRRLLAVALLAAGVVLLATPRSGAAAPDCVKGTREAAGSADAVFTGVVAGVKRTGRGPDNAEFTNTIQVARVYKGPIDQQSVPVLTKAGTRNRPGLGVLERGERYLFYVRTGADVLTAGGCSGTRVADPARVTRVEELLGEGRPAVRPEKPEPPEAEFERVTDSQPVDFTRSAAPGLALVLVGLLGLVVVRRLGRRQPL